MENIEVALRVRPINQQELENNDIEIWTTQASDEVGISAEKYSDLIRMRKIAPGQKTQYLFNKCFDQRTSNTIVYEQIVKRIALSSLKGINGTVFMYGQTGSGKTFTMMGQNREEGINNNCNSKHNLSLQQQMQSGSSKLIGDPLSPKNLISSKEGSSRLSRQQSSQKNLVTTQKINNGQNQQQQQYYSRSPPKQRDSAPLNSTKENQDNFGYQSQYGVINTLRGPTQTNDRNGYPNSTGIGAFKNSGYSFSPMNSRDNFFKKKNSNQQVNQGTSNRSQSVTPDKYLSTNSQKSQMVNPTSSNTLDIFQDPQGQNQKQTGNIAGGDMFNSLSANLANSNQYGVLILSLIDIFRDIQNSPNNQFLLRCSYVEIYTDFVYDLLKPQDKLTETLQIGEDYNKEFYIKGAVEEIVSSIDEIIQLLKYGEYNRHYASTAMNHISSRSHTIFRLYVRTMPKDFTSGNEGITESILNFVDLAGSEKINIHNTINKGSQNNLLGNNTNTAFKDRQIESKTINKSLFFLTQVISLKSQGKQESHIPYRNSPLTKILRSSLGGNSRTAIILCLNPCLSQLEQSVSTLRFGLNAKKIENQVKQNIIQLQNNDILQGMIKEYETRIVELESEKNVNKVNSDNLFKMIQSLIEQKNNLEKRIKAKELFDQQQNVQRQVALGKKRKNINQDFVHLDNVGLIKIYDDGQDSGSEKPYSSRDVSKEIQGNKCAMRKVKNLTEQKRVLEEQLLSCKHQLQNKENEYSKVIQRIDKKLAGKKRKLQTMKANKITLGIENSRLKQELALYKNQNIEGLKKLSVSKLEKLEQNVELLLKNIRNQMSALAIKREFEGDTAILQRINKTLQLRELMDCELVELANDFFEPNLQLNTTNYEDDDSTIQADIYDNFQCHNIHNDILDQQKFLQTQTIEAKSKFQPESPLIFGVSPRDTVSCLSYKADEQYQFMNNNQNQYNNLNLQTSLTNLNQLQSTTQRYGNNKTNVNNMIGTIQDNQFGVSGNTQNFGTFQNYFNQVNNNNQKLKQQQSTSSNQQVTSDHSNLDSETTSNRFGFNPSQQTNNLTADESRSSTFSDNGKLLILDLQNTNKANNYKIYTQEDAVREKQLSLQQKLETNSSITCPSKMINSYPYNTKGNEGYSSNQNILTTGILNSEELQIQQSILQSQQTGGRSSNLDQNNDLNSLIPQANLLQNKSNFQTQEIKSKQRQDELQSIYSSKSQSGQSPIVGNYLKSDLQSHPTRSCSQGQNYRSNQYVTNDINTEATALTQDFQEPYCFDKEVRNYSSQQKNKWEGQKNNRQPSKDKYESTENKYIFNQTQRSQVSSNQHTNNSNNIPHHHSSSSEIGLSEKKLVEKLFGKENKYSQDIYSQPHNKGSSKDALQTPKVLQQNSNSQQKYQQSMKKTLSQKDILGTKLQIIMNQNNNSSISNTTYAHLALQHQQNRHIVQQLMGAQPSRSQQNFSIQPNTQGLPSPAASPKNQNTKENNFIDNGQSYLKMDSNFNRFSANQSLK